MEIYSANIWTPIGEMIACCTDRGICFLEFSDQTKIKKEMSSSQNMAYSNKEHMYLSALQVELREYFDGERESFSVPLDINGTSFQKKVWAILQTIPYGKTTSYKEQAKSFGNLKAVRAIANANGANKIAILIPCHRVIGSDGSLRGYAGGIQRKEFLLNLEKQRVNDVK